MTAIGGRKATLTVDRFAPASSGHTHARSRATSACYLSVAPDKRATIGGSDLKPSDWRAFFSVHKRGTSLSVSEEVIFTPLSECNDNGEQTVSLCREDVFAICGSIRGWHGFENPSLLKVAQSGRQHPFAY